MKTAESCRKATKYELSDFTIVMGIGSGVGYLFQNEWRMGYGGEPWSIKANGHPSFDTQSFTFSPGRIECASGLYHAILRESNQFWSALRAKERRPERNGGAERSDASRSEANKALQNCAGGGTPAAVVWAAGLR